MEYIETKNSLDSKLQTFCIFSIRILNILEAITKTSFSKIANCSTLDQEGRTHYQNRGKLFLIKHYAGEVNYDADGFVEKNRDQVFVDLLEMCKTSANSFIQHLFRQIDPAKKQQTQGSIIRDQANRLVDTLMKCQVIHRGSKYAASVFRRYFNF